MKVNGRVLPSALELRHNAEFGYHIAATRAMEAGTVLSQEAPLTACPAADDLATLCRRCLAPVPLRRTTPHHVCPRCTVVHYCSRYCRRADRDDHHYSGECCLLATHGARDQLDDLLREACLALRLLHIKPPLEPPLSAHPHTLQDPAHIPARDAARLQMAAKYMASALQATHDGACRAPTPPSPASSGDAPSSQQQPQQEGGNVHAVLRHGRSLEALRTASGGVLASVVANALELHPLLVHGEASVGQAPAAVYRLGSRFNHSCRPNLTWSFKQKTHLVLRTLCDVAPGEQLTIAYLDVVAPAPQRAAGLRQQYAFTCGCNRCRAGRWYYPMHGASPAQWRCVDGGAADADAAHACAKRTAHAHDAVSSAAALLIDLGDTAGCAEAMLRALCDARAPPTPLHPLHCSVLEAATCLASACTVRAASGGRGDALRAAGWTLVAAAPGRRLLFGHGERGAVLDVACRSADAAACCYRLLCINSQPTSQDTPTAKRPRHSLWRLEQAILAVAYGDALTTLSIPAASPSMDPVDADDELLHLLLEACYTQGGDTALHTPMPASGEPWLRAACALHCVAAACARVAVGETHPLADRIAFLPFFVGVPVPQASAITQTLLPELVEDAMRVVVDACCRVK